LWDANTIPITVGRLVAETFRRWVLGRAGDDANAVQFCDRKLGILDPDADSYVRSRECRHRLTPRVRTAADLSRLDAVRVGQKLLKVYSRAKYYTTALGGAGVRWFASRPVTETAAYNALVHGGRCHNERPDEYATGPGLDIDIDGCYGESLRTLTYPVGLPTVWSYSPNDRRPTLGEWLGAHEDELVPNLWTVTVSGRLPFEQDLLFSKLVKHRDIRKAAADDRVDIQSDFVLLRREVKNAVITSDLLRAIRKVATKTERRHLMALEVVTAVAYLKADRVDGPGDWCREVLAWKDSGRLVRLKAGTTADDRPRAWYGVPLDEFIGRLVDERRRAKADKDAPPGLEQTLKLMINTLFGVFASRHFSVGNTVLAHNITARGRLGVWMVAKALGLRQSITDGGIYTPSAVPSFRRRRPGFDTLSRPWNWKNTNIGRTFIPLPGLTWDPGTPVPPEAGPAALAHVRRFWVPYDLPFEFNLSHKDGFLRSAYWSKGDYALLTEPGKEPVTKLRGKVTRQCRRDDEVPHPTFALLDEILAGGDVFPPNLTYTTGGIMKVGKYRVIQQSSPGAYVGQKHLRPGDAIPPKLHTAVYNNVYLPVPDEVTFLKRKTRRRKHRGTRVEFFEKYRGQGIAAVHRAMMSDKLTNSTQKVKNTCQIPLRSGKREGSDRSETTENPAFFNVGTPGG
jgi:hypothetical protein